MTGDLLSLSGSSHRRPALLSSLALIRLCRFLLLHDGRDLETSILLSTQTISRPFLRSIEGHLNLILKFFFVTEALFWLSRKYEERGDVIYCIKYLHYLRDRSLRAIGVTRTGVTALIMHALALRVELWPGNVTQGVGEMSVLILLHHSPPSLFTTTSDIHLSPREAFERPVICSTKGRPRLIGTR